METRTESSGAGEADEPAEPHDESAEAADGRESFHQRPGPAEGEDRPGGSEAGKEELTLDARVEKFHEQAHARESGLRKGIKGAIVAAGGIEGREEERKPQNWKEKFEDARRVHLVGLKHSVKDLDSLRRKAADYAAEGVSDEEVTTRIKDALRYTIQLPDDEYSAGAWKAIDTLIAQGHTQLDVKNFWNDEVYRGVNTFWQDAESGLNFEVQFHTRFGYQIKQATHLFYSEQRLPATTDERAEELRRKQMVFTHFVAVPPGAETIVSEKERKRADTEGQDRKDNVMSGESGGEGGAEGGEASFDAGVEAVETEEDAYGSEVPEDDPYAFLDRVEKPDPALYEANATPETDEEREARLRREAAAAAEGLLPVQLAMRAREARAGGEGQAGVPR